MGFLSGEQSQLHRNAAQTAWYVDLTRQMNQKRKRRIAVFLMIINSREIELINSEIAQKFFRVSGSWTNLTIECFLRAWTGIKISESSIPKDVVDTGAGGENVFCSCSDILVY